MPRPRFNKLPAEKREQLMQTAGKEFALYGYEDASMNRILEAVGMSKGAAYYYFDDKTDLFAAVLTHYAAIITGVSDLNPEELTAETFWPAIAAIYGAPRTYIQESPWVMGLFRALNGLSAPVRELESMKTYIDHIWLWFMALAKRGQTLGVVRTDLPDDLLFALIAGMDSAGDQWLLDHLETLTPEQSKEIFSHIVDAIRRVMSP